MLRALFKRVRIVWLIFLDRRTPLWIKLVFGFLAIAYGLSPIDIVPDWLPLAGLIDDLILIPLLLWLASRIAPDWVQRDAEEKAERETSK